MIEIPDEHLARLMEELVDRRNYTPRIRRPRRFAEEVDQAAHALIEIRAYLNAVTSPGLKCDPEDYPLSMYGFVPTLDAIDLLVRQRNEMYRWARKFRGELDELKGTRTRESEWATLPEEEEPQVW